MIIKAENGLVVNDLDSSNALARVKVGSLLKCKILSERNSKFLRKYFALLNFAFDAWEPEEKMYKGRVVQKNKERFRKDIQILAGFGEMVINIQGDIRYESKSIAFGNMSEENFEKLYQAVITVVLEKILTQYNRQDLDDVVEELLRFA